VQYFFAASVSVGYVSDSPTADEFVTNSQFTMVTQDLYVRLPYY